MRAILKQIGYLSMYLGMFYLVLLVLSYVFYPATYKGPIDTMDSGKTVFLTAPRLLAMNAGELASSDKKKLFFLGSSNVEEGFRPDELQKCFPEYEIHNLAIGASNITQVSQVADLLFSALPDKVIESSVFVLGVWYGSFADDATRWQKGVTSLEKELYRYRTYQRQDGKPVPVLGWKALPYWSVLLRPVFFVSGAFEKLDSWFLPQMKRFLTACIHERRVELSMFGRKRIYRKIDDGFKRFTLAFWRRYMGTYDECLLDEQFNELTRLCRVIRGKKARLILVDMPLPQWHCEQSRHFKCYQEKKTEFLADIEHSMGVTYIDLQDLRRDSDFYDSTHPLPRVTRDWSERLCSSLEDMKKDKSGTVTHTHENSLPVSGAK